MTWKLYDSVNFKHFAFSFQLILDKFDTFLKPMSSFTAVEWPCISLNTSSGKLLPRGGLFNRYNLYKLWLLAYIIENDSFRC